eukprot:scaffold78145_cov36-Prasinocladus_malaysianus.AAC.2
MSKEPNLLGKSEHPDPAKTFHLKPNLTYNASKPAPQCCDAEHSDMVVCNRHTRRMSSEAHGHQNGWLRSKWSIWALMQEFQSFITLESSA